MYLSSADWLPRNLDGRIELLSPVESPEFRARVVEALDTMFMDNVKARWLHADGTYKKRRVPKGESRSGLRSSSTGARRPCAGGRERPPGVTLEPLSAPGESI